MARDMNRDRPDQEIKVDRIKGNERPGRCIVSASAKINLMLKKYPKRFPWRVFFRGPSLNSTKSKTSSKFSLSHGGD